ncbi:MAG: hypothetical protein K6T90_18805, partial [Leptolyngbyaceae cyanobacterium HOT.MB2.61]|nr:hypothetical protein [Leptolyngbyaceae cyanobacterium HOT.MB2.61]
FRRKRSLRYSFTGKPEELNRIGSARQISVRYNKGLLRAQAEFVPRHSRLSLFSHHATPYCCYYRSPQCG